MHCGLKKLFNFVVCVFFRFIMCSNPQDLRTMADWAGKGPESRKKLIENLQCMFVMGLS